MNRAVLLVGLPGSGKTHTAVHEFVPRGFLLVDDPRSPEDIREAMATGQDLVITDPFLTVASIRRLAEKMLATYEVEYVFFENDVEKAKANVARRDEQESRPQPTSVDAFARTYEIPPDVPVRPIWTRD